MKSARRRLRTREFGLMVFLVSPLSVILQAAGLETTNAPPLPMPQSSGSLWEVMILQMLGALVFVVSIFILGAWLFKRSRFFSLYKGGPAQLQILESRALGYRNSLLVVGYNQHRFLLATSAAGVSMLTPLPDDSPSAATGGDRPSFSEKLSAIQERKA